WGCGHSHQPVLDYDRRVEPGSVLLDPQLVLLIPADVRDDAREMQHVDKSKAARDVDRGRHLRQLRHPRDSQGTDQAAVVEQIGLHDIANAIGNGPAEAPLAVFLLAEGYGYRE